MTGSLIQPRTTRNAGDESRAAAWFNCALAAFAKAERAAGSVDRHYVIGSLRVRLRFAGPALVHPMTAALDHLAVEVGGSPHLSIHLFDGATGGALPAPPWGPAAYGPRGEIEGFNVGRIRTVYEPGDHTFRMADLSRRCGIFWIRDARAVPYYERGAPLRTLFHWLMGEHGRQLVHAAAVGTPSGGVLLAGKGGSGKSTSAVSCIGSTLLYAGDDYVLLAPGQHGMVVHSLYNSAKLHPEQAEHFPHLRACVDNAGRLATEKALLFLAQQCPKVLVGSLPLHAILVPRITGRPETRVTPASPSAALAALAPTTVFQLPGDGRRTFDVLSALVRERPSYWLELGTGLQRIPEAIAQVLSS